MQCSEKGPNKRNRKRKHTISRKLRNQGNYDDFKVIHDVSLMDRSKKQSILAKVLAAENGAKFLKDLFRMHRSKYVKKLPNDSPRQMLPCKLWTGNSSSKSEYGSVAIGKDVPGSIPIHMLALWAHNGTHPISGKEDTSHDCHEKKCIEPTHLSVVPKKMNDAKKGCLSFVWHKDVDYLQPNQWIDVCTHYPKCLKRDVSNLDGVDAPKAYLKPVDEGEEFVLSQHSVHVVSDDDTDLPVTYTREERERLGTMKVKYKKKGNKKRKTGET